MSEGGSPAGGGSRMWERAGGRGTRQISGDSGDNQPMPCASGHAASAPQADEVGGHFLGTGSGDVGKISSHLLH